MFRSAFSWLIGAAVLLGAVSCSRTPSGGLRMVPAEVVLTYQGKPVEGASVTFVPDSSPNHAAAGRSAPDESLSAKDASVTRKARGAVGRTDAEGRAPMWSLEPGDGVAPGAYRVTIRKLEVLSLPDPESVSPEEYSKLAKKMKAALARPPKSLVPERYGNEKTSDLTVEVVDSAENRFAFELQD